MRPAKLVTLKLATPCALVLIAVSGVARAADAPADVASRRPQSPAPQASGAEDEILRRVLRSGCRDGWPDVQALAAHGSTAWAEPVARLCAEIMRAAPAPRLELASPPLARPKRDGRGAMVISSTLYGLWAGIALDVLFTVDGARSAIIPPLLGMGAGLALSLELTGDHPIDNGQAWTIISGLEFGSVNGALWAGALDFSAKGVVGTTLAAGVASGAVGLLVADARDPRQGDVEVIRSGLIWGTLTGLLGVGLISPNASSQTYLGGTAVAMDLGFLAGLGVAASFDVSRNRDLLVDAGTLGGGLAGLGISWLVAAGPHVSARPILGGALAGMYLGMAAAIYFTRHMPADSDDRGANVAAVWGRDARGRWGWGSPSAAPVLDGFGHRVIGATLTALGGVF